MRESCKSILFLLVVAMFTFLLGGCSNAGDSSAGTETKDEVNHAEHEIDTSSQAKEGNMNEEFAKIPTDYNPNASENLVTPNTKNSTRVPTSNPVDASIYVSQTIWPATHKESQPNAVILASVDNWQAALAGADLIHHPNNGPVLFINKDAISVQVLNEIKRLNPLGNEHGVQVMILGDVSQNVLDELSSYKIEQVKGENPAQFARNVDKLYAAVSGSFPDSVIIVSSEEKNKLYSIPAINWIAHMPEPILFVTENELPEETKDALRERKDKANIYILGPEAVISQEVEKQLEEYGNIKRIAGHDPVATSIEFAKFKDEKTKFGWGLTEPGHGISFISTETPSLALAAAPFSHLGKHAPMVWLNNGEMQKETYDFLAAIKPTFKEDPTTGPYNHSFIIGDTDSISFKTQGIIDEKLEIVQEDGKGHGGH
ncbi:cell wall-binding repeat-containing protein [Metabacillus fastidiosus]|uniref:cell wall-binding repeat-containing protein n=1 Tax=Metabacillus fastidiosus TaxID=1458 RepID=UPI002E20EA19|nr:cell wall-binding repeat-containing protein [Metabacillus fastidiosus]